MKNAVKVLENDRIPVRFWLDKSNDVDEKNNSFKKSAKLLYFQGSRDGGTGRRTGLKIQRGLTPRAGSIPALGTVFVLLLRSNSERDRHSLLPELCLNSNRNSSTDGKFRRHFAPARRKCYREIVENGIGKMLMEHPFIAIRPEI